MGRFKKKKNSRSTHDDETANGGNGGVDDDVFDDAVDGMTDKRKEVRERTTNKMLRNLRKSFDPEAIEFSCESLLEGILRGPVRKGGWHEALRTGALSIGALLLTAAGSSEFEAVNLFVLWRLVGNCDALAQVSRYAFGSRDALEALGLACFVGCKSETEAVGLMRSLEQRIVLWEAEVRTGEAPPLDETEEVDPRPDDVDHVQALSLSLAGACTAWSIAALLVRPGHAVSAVREPLGRVLQRLVDSPELEPVAALAAVQALAVTLELSLNGQAESDDDDADDTEDEMDGANGNAGVPLSLSAVTRFLADLSGLGPNDGQSPVDWRRGVAAAAAVVLDDNEEVVDLVEDKILSVDNARSAILLRVVYRVLESEGVLEHLERNPYLRDVFDLGPPPRQYRTPLDQDFHAAVENREDRSATKSTTRRIFATSEKSRFLARNAQRRAAEFADVD